MSVWIKLGLLLLLVGVGLWRFDLDAIMQTGQGGSVWTALSLVPLGAAVGFMAFEGFQLLSYDYDDIHDPVRTVRRSNLLAIGVTTGVYILVFLAAGSLITSETLIAEKEVALAEAGRAAGAPFPYGPLVGLGLMTIAALFSTGSVGLGGLLLVATAGRHLLLKYARTADQEGTP